MCVHFFLNCGFYQETVTWGVMYPAVLFRTLFMDCVPLFLLLSGFLMNGKQLSLRYYSGILKTVFTYILSGICCLLYSHRNSTLHLKDAAAALCNFTASPYAWYVEMYLGLFMLIPFLNICCNALSSKRRKLALLAVCLSLTALPPFVNGSLKLLPAWWQNLYPVSYFFIGAYLSEYEPKIKSRYLFLLLAVQISAAGSYSFYKSFRNNFIWGPWQDWGSAANTVTAVLVFLLIKSIHTEGWNTHVKAALKYLSELTLGAYLLSWIFDTAFYPVLKNTVSNTFHRFIYLPITVAAVAVLSFLLSAAVTFFSKTAVKAINSLSALAVKKLREHRHNSI